MWFISCLLPYPSWNDVGRFFLGLACQAEGLPAPRCHHSLHDRVYFPKHLAKVMTFHFARNFVIEDVRNAVRKWGWCWTMWVGLFGMRTCELNAFCEVVGSECQLWWIPSVYSRRLFWFYLVRDRLTYFVLIFGGQEVDDRSHASRSSSEVIMFPSSLLIPHSHDC